MRSFLRDHQLWRALANGTPKQIVPDTAESFHETKEFGANPGKLRMFEYVPSSSSSAPRPLVVVLHGCKQSAGLYANGTGWRSLADRYGFNLLLPQQRRSNNQNLCFNWFQPNDASRNRGEALSIRSMIARAVEMHALDPSRIFVTGLSAGGAMTSIMLATYPELFSGGAIVAGLPYGAASNVQQAFEAMFRCPPRASVVLGDLVRAAAPRPVRWPRISVWHGSADHTVIPANATEIVKQWTNVHGLGFGSAIEESDRHGVCRQVWGVRDNEAIVELITISGFGHGAPIDVRRSGEGSTSAFLVDAGIYSSLHIARFFGLADNTAELELTSPPTARAQHFDGAVEPEVLRPSSSAAVGTVIDRALRAAGLMR